MIMRALLLSLALGAFGCASGGHAHAPAAGAASQPASAPKAFPAAPEVGTSATCAVSGDAFTVAADTERSEHGGQHYVFCCPGCKKKFDAAPDKFTAN